MQASHTARRSVNKAYIYAPTDSHEQNAYQCMFLLKNAAELNNYFAFTVTCFHIIIACIANLVYTDKLNRVEHSDRAVTILSFLHNYNTPYITTMLQLDNLLESLLKVHR